jgi:hypothetical protein
MSSPLDNFINNAFNLVCAIGLCMFSHTSFSECGRFDFDKYSTTAFSSAFPVIFLGLSSPLLLFETVDFVLARGFVFAFVFVVLEVPGEGAFAEEEEDEVVDEEGGFALVLFTAFLAVFFVVALLPLLLVDDVVFLAGAFFLFFATGSSKSESLSSSTNELSSSIL